MVTPEASRELARLIPGSVLHMHDAYSHAAYEEADEDFKRLVLDFLEQ